MTIYKIDHDNNKITKENKNSEDSNNKSKQNTNKEVISEIDIGSPLEPEKDINSY